MSGHTAHVAGTHALLAESNNGAAGVPQSQHRHDDADGPVQHHALQDLSGVLVCPDGRCESASIHVVVAARGSNPLLAADAVRLERPPKFILSI